MKLSEVRTTEDLLGILNLMISQRKDENHKTFVLNVIYQGLNAEIEGYDFIYHTELDLETAYLGRFEWVNTEEDEDK